MQLNRFTGARLCAMAAVGALWLQAPSQASESNSSSEAVIRLASVEWPPYSSAALPGGGLTSSVVAAAFAGFGKTAQIEFFPWKRTMMAGTTMSRYAGYFPLWHTKAREKSCYFSAPVARTRTVLAHLRDAPLAPTQLEQLRGLRVGVVAGFANGEQLDAMIADGRLNVEEGLSDEINLRKLLAGRMQVIVIEQRVLQYLLSSKNVSAADRERVVVIDHLVDEREVYVCFKRTPEGLKLRAQFDAALKRVNPARMASDYMKAYVSKQR